MIQFLKISINAIELNVFKIKTAMSLDRAWGTLQSQGSSWGRSFQVTEGSSSSLKASNSCSLESSRKTCKQGSRQTGMGHCLLWFQTSATSESCTLAGTHLLQGRLREAVLLQVEALFNCKRIFSYVRGVFGVLQKIHGEQNYNIRLFQRKNKFLNMRRFSARSQEICSSKIMHRF